ncbi:MAG: DUF4145 domain-containing protein [Chroococcus sp. CMT-3BRIN-NPC107]|nr:DUF4145 domain-containing protein [Chroococcus sp. CMT-3BRIN-NPC107]
MNQVYRKRFQELADQLIDIEKRKTPYNGTLVIGENNDYIDDAIILNWKVKVRNLLDKVCGEDSQHFRQFEENENSSHFTNYENLRNLKAVFQAAREDFEGGYLSSIRSLVQAEVFDSELEQAEELMKNGYVTAAAVIAGVVLETALRELCDRSSIAYGKLDKMNADLAKASVYNKGVQKRITALADIRNSAAHGKPEEFKEQDVLTMLQGVERFLTDYISI